MFSPLQKKRLAYKPKIPPFLIDLQNVRLKTVDVLRKAGAEIEKQFPKSFSFKGYELEKGAGKKGTKKIGVVFSGGPAPGGHNVIAALFDSGAELIGFINGASGIIENKTKEIKDVENFRNQGGFDLIGTGRTKIEGVEALESSMKTVQALNLDGLVIIGGDDSNTNGAVLAEYFLEKGCKCAVVGVPKTIDADLRSEDIELTFGFDTASKTYSELIGNIARDALSSQKYYHFIRLMGRSASHITLECALKTQPNLALISEERRSIEEIVGEIVDLIIEREAIGKRHGVILVPEGLIEFVPELASHASELKLETDPHGNVEVSKIDTEKFLIDLVKKELEKRSFKGKFHALNHSFGYEGRCAAPSNFDANYCYTLGLIAAVAIQEGVTGVIACVQNLKCPPDQWTGKLIPIVHLFTMEKRKNVLKPVIEKALVSLESQIFKDFSKKRECWKMEDSYQFPGPIQYYGDVELTDSVPFTL